MYFPKSLLDKFYVKKWNYIYSTLHRWKSMSMHVCPQQTRHLVAMLLQRCHMVETIWQRCSNNATKCLVCWVKAKSVWMAFLEMSLKRYIMHHAITLPYTLTISRHKTLKMSWHIMLPKWTWRQWQNCIAYALSVVV